MGILNGKAVIVTGAGTGFGKALAKLFVAEGAKITICGRRINKINQLKDELTDHQDRVLALSADVSQQQDVLKVVNHTLERFGKIDILINNAAVYESASIVETSLDSWNYQLSNNVTSAFLMSRAVIPIMRAHRGGRIINVTSSLAATGGNGFGAYSASKAAIETLTFTIDEEESHNGILATVINPGVMKTEMQARGNDPRKVALNLLKFIGEEKSNGKVIHLDELYNTEYYI